MTWPPSTHQDVADQIDAKALTLIASTTALGSPDFTSIPQTYKHLLLVAHGRTGRASEYDSERISINGDGGANYDYLNVQWTGAAADAPVQLLGSSYIEVGTWPGANAAAGAVGTISALITNYTDTNLFKDVLVDFTSCGTANLRRGMVTGIWHSTAAVNRLQLIHLIAPVAGSVQSLYGVS